MEQTGPSVSVHWAAFFLILYLEQTGEAKDDSKMTQISNPTKIIKPLAVPYVGGLQGRVLKVFRGIQLLRWLSAAGFTVYTPRKQT